MTVPSGRHIDIGVACVEVPEAFVVLVDEGGPEPGGLLSRLTSRGQAVLCFLPVVRRVIQMLTPVPAGDRACNQFAAFDPEFGQWHLVPTDRVK